MLGKFYHPGALRMIKDQQGCIFARSELHKPEAYDVQIEEYPTLGPGENLAGVATHSQSGLRSLFCSDVQLWN